jgi:hypothetical protein
MSSALTLGLRASVATDITSAAAFAAAPPSASSSTSSLHGLMQRGSWISSFHAPASSSVALIRPRTTRDLLLDKSPTNAGVEWKRNVEATRPAITAQLVARAKEAGLGPTQAAQTARTSAPTPSSWTTCSRPRTRRAR